MMNDNPNLIREMWKTWLENATVDELCEQWVASFLADHPGEVAEIEMELVTR